jgi:RND family efflux transporter MFP subunit
MVRLRRGDCGDAGIVDRLGRRRSNFMNMANEIKPRADTDGDILARLANVAAPKPIPGGRSRQARPQAKGRPRWLSAGAVLGAMLLTAVATHQFVRWNDGPVAPAASEVSAAKEGAGEAVAVPAGGDVVLEASGFVVARNKASVSSDITGRVASIAVELGQVVRAGQVIAVLDDREAKLRLNAARLQMQNDRLDADSARVQAQLEQDRFARLSTLAGSGFASRASFEQGQAALDSARIRVNQAAVGRVNGANSYEAAKIFVERHVIRAPFGGVITEVTARPGETVSPTSGGGSFIRTGIVQLIDPASLYITAEVPEKQIGAVSVGAPVEIVSASRQGPAIRTSVAWISPISNRQRGIIEVGLNLPASARGLIDGMEVDVRFLKAAGSPKQREQN